MTRPQLTDKEKRFLTAVFDLSPSDFKSERARLLAAMELAGYSEGTSPYNLMNKLKEEIIRTAQEYAAMQLPRSMKLLADIVDGTEKRLGLKDAIKAVELLAGFGGLVKQDKATEATVPTQVIVMPEKNSKENVTFINKDI